MLRRRVMLVIAVSGAAAVALSVEAQPVDTPREVRPPSRTEANNASPPPASLDAELAYEVWQFVLPDALEPLPAPSTQPAQLSSAIVRSGELEVVVRAQRNFERSRDAELRALHESIDDEERQILQSYVDDGSIQLPQLRRAAVTEAVCRGKARTGADLAAAHLGADALHAERMLELVRGLTTVLDADSYDRVVARGASRDNRSGGLVVVNLPTNRASRYDAMSQEQVIAEINRTCRGVWSYHSDAQSA